jgi:hypothetical protein
MLTNKSSDKKVGGKKDDQPEKVDPSVELTQPMSKFKVEHEGDPEVELKVAKLRVKVETEDAIRHQVSEYNQN